MLRKCTSKGSIVPLLPAKFHQNEGFPIGSPRWRHRSGPAEKFGWPWKLRFIAHHEGRAGPGLGIGQKFAVSLLCTGTGQSYCSLLPPDLFWTRRRAEKRRSGLQTPLPGLNDRDNTAPFDCLRTATTVSSDRLCRAGCGRGHLLYRSNRCSPLAGTAFSLFSPAHAAAPGRKRAFVDPHSPLPRSLSLANMRPVWPAASPRRPLRLWVRQGG